MNLDILLGVLMHMKYYNEYGIRISDVSDTAVILTAEYFGEYGVYEERKHVFDIKFVKQADAEDWQYEIYLLLKKLTLQILDNGLYFNNERFKKNVK